MVGLAQIFQKENLSKKEQKKDTAFLLSTAQMLAPSIKPSVQIYIRVRGCCGLLFAFAQTDLGTKVG